MQLDYAIPASKISGLSSGEFVGMVADDPNNKIELKTFHNAIQNDHDAIKAEEQYYLPIPNLRDIEYEINLSNYHQIKENIKSIVATVYVDLRFEVKVSKIQASFAEDHFVPSVETFYVTLNSP